MKDEQIFSRAQTLAFKKSSLIWSIKIFILAQIFQKGYFWNSLQGTPYLLNYKVMHF